MHAIERPRLPRVGVLALGAVLLVIVVLLLTAYRIGDIRITSSSGSSTTATSPGAKIQYARAPASSWLTNPFISPFRVVVSWTTAARR
jgi:hypothetical protein